MYLINSNITYFPNIEVAKNDEFLVIYEYVYSVSLSCALANFGVADIHTYLNYVSSASAHLFQVLKVFEFRYKIKYKKLLR